ncbi:MAG: PIN domain-containing protein [Anaerolineae bacterium]|nr:PIN domain-containing protein [Anaerolineae bacterium]
MGTLSELSAHLARAERLALDTVAFIYAFEHHPDYGPPARVVFDALEAGLCRGCASTLALGEVLAGVHKAGDAELALHYRDVLTRFPGLTLVDAGVPVMERMANLRARYGLPTPDAIHLATALHWGAQVFVSNDLRLRRVQEIEVVLLSEWREVQ